MSGWVLLGFLAASLSSPSFSSITLTPQPSVVSDGGTVLITWGSFVPDNTDTLVFTCGPTNGLDDVIDRRPLTNGGVHFTNLVNMRCDYVFALQRNLSGSLEQLAAVTVQVEGGPYVPIQGHISLADHDDEMWVSWVSGREPASPDTTPTVRYGTASGQYDFTQTATSPSTTYQASDLCDSPANHTTQILWRFPGYFHHVLLTQLKPSTLYYFVYGTNKDGWSGERAFRSKPVPAANVAKFLAYADQDWDEPSPGSPTTAAFALRDVMNGYDSFLLHFGDISYGMGDVSDWDHWGREVEPYATRVPYMISLGNHEFDYEHGGEHSPTGGGPTGFHPEGGELGADSNGECGVPVVHRFRAPNNGNLIAWYSFDFGPVHVVQFSSEHNWTKGSTQWLWLQKDLQAVNRTLTPWVVVTMHRMVYSTQSDAGKTPQLMRDNIEDLLYQNKVNLVIVGHQHSYERMCPVYRGECVADGAAPTYINVGTAGAGIDYKPFNTSNYSLVQATQWGYVRGSVTAQNLTVQFVANSIGEVWDEVVLQRWG